MEYKNIKEGVFLSRPNRFIAHVNLHGKEEICHVKNTGRCRELLVPGATVYVEKSENPLRKTKYDLVCVQKGDTLINMDSYAPNLVFGEWAKESGFFHSLTLFRPEYTYKNSRFDFYMETKTEKILVEVKGVTLEEEGIVRFPDAPTKRGTKHLTELMEAAEDGYKPYVFFIAQMKDVRHFEPNTITDPDFSEALKRAKEKGVGVYCLSCMVTPETLKIADFVPVLL